MSCANNASVSNAWEAFHLPSVDPAQVSTLECDNSHWSGHRSLCLRCAWGWQASLSSFGRTEHHFMSSSECFACQLKGIPPLVCRWNLDTLGPAWAAAVFLCESLMQASAFLSNSAHHFAPISPWPSNRDHDAKDPMQYAHYFYFPLSTLLGIQIMRAKNTTNW